MGTVRTTPLRATVFLAIQTRIPLSATRTKTTHSETLILRQVCLGTQIIPRTIPVEVSLGIIILEIQIPAEACLVTIIQAPVSEAIPEVVCSEIQIPQRPILEGCLEIKQSEFDLFVILSQISVF